MKDFGVLAIGNQENDSWKMSHMGWAIIMTICFENIRWY